MRQPPVAAAILLTLAVGRPLLASPTARPHAAATEERRASPVAAVLTTDCGVDTDDQWALAHLLLSPEIDLRAVVTSHASSIGFAASASAAKAAEVVAHVLLVGSPAPPVLAGSDSPLRNETTPQQSAGVDKLLEVSRGFSASRRLVVFTIGAATDVASAILKDPSLVNRISVVAMGFDDWPRGGDEFNIKNDPLAWRVILDSDVPLVVGSGTVTRRGLRLTRAEAHALMGSHGPVGQYLDSVFDDFLTQRASLVAQVVAPDTWVVWDEVVVAYALGMARGSEVPRPRLRPDMTFSHPETSRRITWLSEIDTGRFWLDFTRKIDANELRRK